MEGKYVFKGRCHCGAINALLEFTKPAHETQTRSCQCGFCRRHGAITISEPGGRAMLDIAAGQVGTYQFATRTATCLICNHCGSYIGAVLQEGAMTWSIANTRGLAITEFKDRTGEPMVYENETATERAARRKQRWTPTEIHFKV